MPDNKVVNLNEFGPTRRSADTEPRMLLDDARVRLIEWTCLTLTRQAEAMETALLNLADRSPLLDTRNLYFGAQGLLGKQSNDIWQAWKVAYQAYFNRHTQKPQDPRSASPGELSLVDDNDFETTLAINKASARLRYACAEELVALDARAGCLLGRKQLSGEDNPLGPRALCQTLFDGLDTLGIEARVQVVLLNQFDLCLMHELPAFYQALNRDWLARGILPDLKAGFRPRQANPPHTLRPGTEPDLASMMDRLAAAPAAPVTHPGPGHTMAGHWPYPQGALAPSAMRAATGTGLPALPMMQVLGQLQSGVLHLPEGGTLEMQAGDAQTNVLRTLQHSSLMQQTSALDAVMVDAVAMLFDVIFDDEQLPDNLKALIGRLQIPMLKLALCDRSFFSRRDHEARRLLDRIAHLSMRLDGCSQADCLTRLEQIIQTLIQNFDRDKAAIAQALDGIEKLASEQESQLEASIAPRIAELEKSERQAGAASISVRHVNRALADLVVPERIASFLQQEWSQLLEKLHVDHGETSPLFAAAVETMRELVWSVQTKTDMDARLMLVRILPSLLKRLREGLNAIHQDSAAADLFFTDLVGLHAQAVRSDQVTAELPGEGWITPSPLPEPPPPADPEPLPDIRDEALERASRLDKGTWVEFHHQDGNLRWARIAHISSIKGDYLFTDQDGLNMFSISVPRLAEKLRNGEAVLVNSRSLSDSVFGKLRDMFKLRLSHT
jgi:hypothetical protein